MLNLITRIHAENERGACALKKGPVAARAWFTKKTGIHITASDWHIIRRVAEINLGHKLSNRVSDSRKAMLAAAAFADSLNATPEEKRSIMYDLATVRQGERDVAAINELATNGLPEEVKNKTRRVSAQQREELEIVRVHDTHGITVDDITLDADEHTLQSGALSDDPQVRAAVAEHPNVGYSTAMLLANDPDRDVRWASLANPDASEGIVNAVFESTQSGAVKDWELAGHAVAHPNAGPLDTQIFAAAAPVEHIGNLRMNRYADPDALAHLADRPEPEARTVLAGHPNAHKADVIRALSDPDTMVRKAAEREIRRRDEQDSSDLAYRMTAPSQFIDEQGRRRDYTEAEYQAWKAKEQARSERDIARDKAKAAQMEADAPRRRAERAATTKMRQRLGGQDAVQAMGPVQALRERRAIIEQALGYYSDDLTEAEWAKVDTWLDTVSPEEAARERALKASIANTLRGQ